MPKEFPIGNLLPQRYDFNRRYFLTAQKAKNGRRPVKVRQETRMKVSSDSFPWGLMVEGAFVQALACADDKGFTFVCKATQGI
jgi:hypothetical protein